MKILKRMGLFVGMTAFWLGAGACEAHLKAMRP